MVELTVEEAIDWSLPEQVEDVEGLEGLEHDEHIQQTERVSSVMLRELGGEASLCAVADAIAEGGRSRLWLSCCFPRS